MVHLDVLARRDVALVQRHVLLDHVGERLHLLRRDAAEGELHADHLHVGLALAVDALLEAELDELVFLGLAREEFRRLGLEVVELALQDRDHVPGHVLEHLWVLQRAALGRGLKLAPSRNLLVRTRLPGLRSTLFAGERTIEAKA